MTISDLFLHDSTERNEAKNIPDQGIHMKQT